jgi:hypothetical protein
MRFSFVFSQEKKESLRVKTNFIFITGMNLEYVTDGLKGYHANIAKKSYVGLGLNLNLGWHKKYK